MSSSEKELEERLKEAGNELINRPPTADELLKLLESIENLLTKVEQEPSTSIQNALLPSMKALISDDLLKHPDMDVKVSVAYCVTEITRITAPENPYNDEKMKDIFGLTIAAFEMLSHEFGHSYSKVVSILDTVAKVRSCLVMLDLECDDLIIEMFHQFLKIIRPNHPHVVYSSMETIMTNVLDESEVIASDLLSPLLASVRKENQDAALISCKLGEKVMMNCAAKLKPYLVEAVQSTGLSDYAPVVALICQNGSDKLEPPQIDDALDHLVVERTLDAGTKLNESSMVKKKIVSDVSLSEATRAANPSFESVVTVSVASPAKNGETSIAQRSSRKSRGCHVVEVSNNSSIKGNEEPDNSDHPKGDISRKRGRKPNSLMNPEEGYDGTWKCSRGKAPKRVCHIKSDNKETENLPSENPNDKNAKTPSTMEKETFPSTQTKTDEGNALSQAPIQSPSNSIRKRGRPKKTPILGNQDADHVEEKCSKSEDVSLRKTPEIRRKSNSKSKSTQETTSSLCLVSDNEASVTPCSGEKLVRNPIMKFKREIMDDDKSIDKKDAKRSIPSPSGSKMIGTALTKSSDKEDNLGEFLRTKVKMKNAAKKEKASKIPFSGGELVGWRIKVWWPIDKKFYEGIIHSYDPLKKKHKVLYGDGDEENLNLSTQRYELIGDELLPDTEGSMPRVQASDSSKPGSSSDILNRRRSRKQKRQTESANQAKSAPSLRRRTASDGKSKIEESVEKSGHKQGDEKPSAVDESVDNDRQAEKIEKGGGKKSIILKFSKLNTGVEIICKD